MPIINQRNVAVTAATDILGADITSVNPDGWLVITVIPNTTGRLSVIHVDENANRDEGFLFNDTDLVANNEYSFNVPVPTNPTPPFEKELINIRYSVNATFTKLIIQEGA